MDDREALLRAVAASPDDDLPRLVLADWWEDRGESEYAAFVRAQVELARTPEWEPFAVHCRQFRRDDWVLGTPFWKFLPAVDGHRLEWHPEHAFRRGFAWGLIVRDVTSFLEWAPRLFEAAPIGQLHLPTATLDQWRRFARAEWLPRVRSIHFYGTSTPIEPVRVLCESERATGLEEIVFQAASSPAMPVLLTDLLQSPVGRRLRSLELRVGPDSIVGADELYFSIAGASPPPELRRLMLVNLSPGEIGMEALFDSELFSRLSHLSLVQIPGVQFPFYRGRLTKLDSLSTVGCGLRRQDVAGLFQPLLYPLPPDLRELDLSENPLGEWKWTRIRVHERSTRELRSLALRRTGLEDRSVEMLTMSTFWPGFVRLDLRDNRITNGGALALLDAPRPRELTALLLGGNRITPHMSDRLRGHFGECVSFDAGEVGNGLR